MASEYPLNKADIIYRKNQLAFIKKLEGHFGSQLAFLLHGVLVRSFYNQEVSFDKEKEVESG